MSDTADEELTSSHVFGLVYHLLPTENRLEFVDMLVASFGEFHPRGELQISLVVEITHLNWRKKDIGIFKRAELERVKNHRFLKEETLEAARLARMGEAIDRLFQVVEEAIGDGDSTIDSRSEWERGVADRSAWGERLIGRLIERSGKAVPAAVTETVSAASSNGELSATEQAPGQHDGSVAARAKAIEHLKMKVLSATKGLLGSHAAADLLAQTAKTMENGDGLDLAWLGPELTAAYREELDLVQKIDEAIELKLKILFRLQREGRRRRQDARGRLRPAYR